MSDSNGRPGSRRSSRELLVKALYQWQLSGTPVADLVAQFSETRAYAAIDQSYFEFLLPTITENAGALDAIIEEHADRPIAELDPIGRSILLLSLTEFSRCEDVPTRVIINEAVELAKRYGPAESFRFVNALLDKAAHELRE
jgi:N utilization substance protein B